MRGMTLILKDGSYYVHPQDVVTLPIISSSHFTWMLDPAGFVGEASDLEQWLADNFFKHLGYLRGQWGFVMKSDRTGRCVWFQRSHELRSNDVDEELISTIYICHELNGLSLTVFND